MVKTSLQIALLLSLFLLSASVQAELLSYQDASGARVYVDDISKVPERYRNSVERTRRQGSFSKLPSRDFATSPSRKSVGPVELFVTSWCPHCRRAEEFLKSHNVRYRRFDIERSALGQKKYNKLGVRGIPVIKIGTQVYRGFQPGELYQALNLGKYSGRK